MNYDTSLSSSLSPQQSFPENNSQVPDPSILNGSSVDHVIPGLDKSSGDHITVLSDHMTFVPLHDESACDYVTCTTESNGTTGWMEHDHHGTISLADIFVTMSPSAEADDCHMAIEAIADSTTNVLEASRNSEDKTNNNSVKCSNIDCDERFSSLDIDNQNEISQQEGDHTSSVQTWPCKLRRPMSQDKENHQSIEKPSTSLGSVANQMFAVESTYSLPIITALQWTNLILILMRFPPVTFPQNN